MRDSIINGPLPTTDSVPADQASAKKLYGRRPIKMKSQKCSPPLLKTNIKTKVSTAIMMSGLTRDQKTPSDIFR